MSTAVTMERLADTSPRLKARLAGVLYLLTGLLRLTSSLSSAGLLYTMIRRLPRPTSWRTSSCFDWVLLPRSSHKR